MREDHSRPVLTQPEKLLHSRELLSEIIPCLVRRLARFKREQGQTETDDLEEHSMQRGLIRQRPREQRRPGLLLRVSSLRAVLAKANNGRSPLSSHRSGKSIAEREPFHSRQKYAKGSSCMRRKATCWEESR